MTLLTKEAILAAEDRKTTDVDCPEWGGAVRVATIQALVHDRWMARHAKDGASPEMFRIQYVALCCVDGEGNPLFTPDDVEALGRKSFQPINRLYEAAAELNGLATGVAEDVAKNSDAGQSAGSSSESPGD